MKKTLILSLFLSSVFASSIVHASEACSLNETPSHCVMRVTYKYIESSGYPLQSLSLSNPRFQSQNMSRLIEVAPGMSTKFGWRNALFRKYHAESLESEWAQFEPAFVDGHEISGEPVEGSYNYVKFKVRGVLGGKYSGTEFSGLICVRVLVYYTDKVRPTLSKAGIELRGGAMELETDTGHEFLAY